MKLFAFPLTRRPEVFTFYAKRTSIKGVNPGGQGIATAKPARPLLTRLTDKAGDFWIKLGQGKKDGWRYKTYSLGEKLLDRIEFEEWALKGVDVVAAKSMATATATNEKQGERKDANVIYFPPRYIQGEQLIKSLKEMALTRVPHHKRRMIINGVLVPFTFPFALIPVVPNFPMFWLLFRSWSHWKAWKSSSHLLELLQRQDIHAAACEKLDKAYERNLLDKTHNAAPSRDSSSTQILISSHLIDDITKDLDLEEARNDLRRAMIQVEARYRLKVGNDQPAHDQSPRQSNGQEKERPSS